MKIKISFIATILIGFIIVSCSLIPPLPEPVSEFGPYIRVGIAENLASVSFDIDGDIAIWDQNDRVMATDLQGKRWKVHVQGAAPVNLKFRLLYREVADEYEAERLAADLEYRGQPAVIKLTKKRTFVGSQIRSTNSYQIFLQPIFDSTAEANRYRSSLGDDITTTILPFFDSRPKGAVILTNMETGERFQSAGLIRVWGNRFKLNVKKGEGFHFENKVDRSYWRQLEFWIDRYGGITVVNEIPLEIYLRGVVGSEMSTSFPVEALKAQAVTARGYTLKWIGKVHRLSPYDICDEVHCHVYGGVDRESPRIIEVVDKTRGQVLMYGDQICDTRYAGVCGGHTENNEDVWFNVPQPYLRGRLDSGLGHLFSQDYLTSESRVRQWIESSPDVYCNTTRRQVPEYLNYTKKYFRWSVRYSKAELSRIIANKTGQNIGSLIQIKPLERGVSGRIKRVELRGTRKSIVIERELEIRKALSSNYLYSSCFVVDRDGNDFIIKGAGWGHGVGMCQTGAAMMALDGHNFHDILNHYYQNSELVKLY